MISGTGLEDFTDPIFVCCNHAPDIHAALDTFALPENHFTLPHAADDDCKMPAQQSLSSPGSSWQLTIDLSSDDGCDNWSSSDSDSARKADLYPASTDMEMKEVDAGNTAVRKSRRLQGKSAKEW
mmetsp:Transcript_16194/g.33815  ORF Transcript_16194/g.33815 Transcript_16194/m.33815 type:complete len:125 (-) Transcript_16194:58-432(-)